MTERLKQPFIARRADAVIFERFESETLLFEPENDRYVQLNRAGSQLWEALERPAHGEELTELLVAQWGIPAEEAQRDVLAFVDSLVKRGMIELEPPPL